MNFSYALENGYVDYLLNNLSGSVYPVLRGFNTGSFDFNATIVHCESFNEPEDMKYTGNMDAVLHICVITDWNQTTASIDHDNNVSQVDALTRTYESASAWINNPSSSMLINGIMFDGCSNVIKDQCWETQYHFKIKGQQQYTTSSFSWYRP